MNGFIKSFGFALKGILCCLPGGTNFKIQLALGALSFLLGFIFHVSTTEWIVLVCCTMLVLSLEMLNTAIEKLCDLVMAGFHPQVKIIKDVAAGAVLVSAAGSGVAGLFIFLPKILLLIKSF
jgi:undecaprenol kinase